LIKVGGSTVHCEIHKLISVWDKEELPEEWKESIIVPIDKKKALKQIVVIIGAYHFCQLCTEYYPTSCSQGKFICRRNCLVISTDFNAADQLLIIYSAFFRYLRKNWEYNELVNQPL
jgi:hypothetical protein